MKAHLKPDSIKIIQYTNIAMPTFGMYVSY